MKVVEDKINSKNDWKIDSVGNSRTILLEFESKVARHVSYKSWQLSGERRGKLKINKYIKAASCRRQVGIFHGAPLTNSIRCNNLFLALG